MSAADITIRLVHELPEGAASEAESVLLAAHGAARTAAAQTARRVEEIKKDLDVAERRAASAAKRAADLWASVEHMRALR